MLSVGLALVILAAFGVSPAWASTITVTNTNDSGAGSLRQAIADASPGDTVVVPANASHYAVTSGELTIGKNLTITGGGARGTVIDAMGGSHRVLEITAGTVSISGVTITGGNVEDQGGGILLDGGTNVTLANVTVSGNTADLNGNYDGGGIEADGTSLTITASTIADNLAYNGGGLDLDGPASVVNSTITGNQAGNTTRNGDGGGISFSGGGSVALTNDTIANNESFNGTYSGGGIDGLATLKNTIVADNTDNSGTVDNCDDETQNSTGPNLENGSDCGFAAHGGISNVNPLLGPLANNGGQTDTQALLAGSPAIDSGTNSGCPPTDQRGGARPQPPGGKCDIGAYEYGSLADMAVSQSGSPNPVNAETNLTYKVTASDNGPDPAAGIVVQDVLPAAAVLESASSSQGSCTGSAPVRCAIGTLGVGASATVTLVVRPTTIGAATNTATISGNPTDPNPANNQSALAVAVRGPPVLSGVHQSHRRWREGHKLAHFSRSHGKPPRGTTFSFTLDEQASVTFQFTQRVPGRRVDGKCRRTTKANRGKATCKRTVTRGTLSLAGHPGKNKVSFQGRISRSKKLKPGSYKLVITATNGLSSSQSLHFTIVTSS